MALSAATVGVLALGPSSLSFAATATTSVPDVPVEAPISFGERESMKPPKLYDTKERPWWMNKGEEKYFKGFEPRVKDNSLPGFVERPTKREQAMRWKLRKKLEIDPSEFDRLIQVFAQRARQDLKYNSIQRREFIRRSKRWTGEMVMQGMKPSTLSMKILLLGASAVGDCIGAAWWLRWMERSSYPVGRFEYNAMIDTFATDGLPEQAEEWIEKMKEAGMTPDARSYASVVRAWGVVGNRKRMLVVMKELRQKEDAGQLGEPLDPDDVSLPYYALAKTYVPSGDTPRVLAILKSARERGLPMNKEAHLIRLATQWRIHDDRPALVNPQEVAKAFDALLDFYKPGEPLLDSRIKDFVWELLGEYEVLEPILEQHGMLNNPNFDPEDLVTETTPFATTLAYNERRTRVAMWKSDAGRTVLLNVNEDAKWFKDKISMRRGAKMGRVYGGRREPGPKGLPEWMAVTYPEKYG